MMLVERWASIAGDGTVSEFPTRDEALAAGGQVRNVSREVPAEFRLWDEANQRYVGTAYRDPTAAAIAQRDYPGTKIRMVPSG